MNKIIVFLCALGLVLALTACQEPAVGPETPDQAQTPEEPATDGPALPEQPAEDGAAASGGMRPDEAQIPVQVEGTEEDMAGVLWQTESFSVYVPSVDWAKDSDRVWRPDNNAQVGFFVLEYADVDLDQAKEQLKAAYSGYTFEEEDGQIIRGKDEAGQMILRAKLVADEDACYAVCAQYPLNAAEGYGARLAAFTETFALK